MPALHLHLDRAARVWMDDDDDTTDTFLSATEFAARENDLLEAADSIRLLGTGSNAELVLALAHHRDKLRLGSPAVLSGTHAEPSRLLRYLRHLSGRSGFAREPWYPLTPKVLDGYRLAFALNRTGHGSKSTAELLTRHPAWPALSFVPTLDRPRAAQLLGRIVDPRWFRHPSRPERLSRLWRWLGLAPHNAAVYLGKAEGPWHNYQVAQNVFAAWYSPDDPAAASEHFLWRLYRGQADRCSGLLAGTLCFVRFVVAWWLSALSDQPMCESWDFFKDETDRAAFAGHLAHNYGAGPSGHGVVK